MFKLLVISALVAVAAADVSHLFRKPTPFLTPFPQQRQIVRPLPVAPVVYQQPQYQPRYQHPEGHSGILRQSQESNPDGSYSYGYETDNGIAVQESASLRQVGADVSPAVQGSYSYVSPEGEHVSINYVADENGYHAEGSHIPTPPPIPAAIARSLEWIAAHPYKSADDGIVINRPAYSPYRRY